MLFNSLAYIFCILGVRLGTILSSRPFLFFLGGSIIFYAFAGLLDTGIFISSLFVNWGIARFVTAGKLRVAVAALFNMGLLFAFKYADLFLSWGANVDVQSHSYIDIALPLGISFYSFQIVAYHVDVMRGVSRPASSFKSFALFISFFPQLVAGPIVRAQELLPQVERLAQGDHRRVRLYVWGIALFALGLVKKVYFADSIAPHVDEIFAFGPENWLWAWLGSCLFAFQIYFDFSGYSDMAIGSAFLLGIRLPLNFRTPYLSRNPREFWQRWHITLSRWIRDYIYIPLGGSRGSRTRVAVVLVSTMAIAGLWHGAGLSFVLWGAGWGLYILLARFVPQNFYMPTVLAIALNFVVTIVLWVLFRSPDMTTALSYYGVMFGLAEGAVSDATFYKERGLLSILGTFAVVLYMFHIFENILYNKRTLYWLKRYQGPFLTGGLLALIFAVLLLQQQNVNPFIYFRF